MHVLLLVLILQYSSSMSLLFFRFFLSAISFNLAVSKQSQVCRTFCFSRCITILVVLFLLGIRL